MILTATDHLQRATQSLHFLRKLAARKGDPEAVKALRDIGLMAASILKNLTDYPDTDETPEVFRGGAAITKQIAKESSLWPIAYDAISEMRKTALSHTDNLGVGSLLGIRLAGKARDFDYHSQTGFVLDLFNQIEEVRLNPDGHFHITTDHPEWLEDGMLTEIQMKFTWQNLAATLPPLSKDSHPRWVAACMELCREDCEGDWKSSPLPKCVISQIDTAKDKDGGRRQVKNIISDVILKGLKMLIP